MMLDTQSTHHMTTELSSQRDRIFRFGAFELSEREGELRKNGVRIKLQEHPLRVLLELASNSGRLVTREELQQKLWPADTFVDFDVGVNTAIRKLRQALGDEAENPRFIETMAKRGYRFVVPVSEVAAAPQSVSKDPPAEAPVSVSSDSTPMPLPDTVVASKSAVIQEKQHKRVRWYWVLAAACARPAVTRGRAWL